MKADRHTCGLLPSWVPCDACRQAKALSWCVVVAVGLLLAFAWLSGCGACPTAYRYDGGATARPYYKVAMCPGKPARVVCDSPKRLPNEDCQ